MGSVFSKDASEQDVETEYDRYLKAVAEEDKNIAQHKEEAKVLEVKKADLIKQAQVRQEEVRVERSAEVKYIVQRIQEIKDKRKAMNIHAATIIVELLFNYENGLCYDPTSRDKIKAFYIQHSTYDAFNLLCKIPLFVPLLWPTGEKDDAFQKNTIIDYDYLEKYVVNDLPEYLTNVSARNQVLLPDTDNQTRAKLETECRTFINQQTNAENETDFVKRTITFLKKTEIYSDPLKWKMLRAMSDKNICSETIKILPANYPKVVPGYEFREALAMLMNICFQRYGRCLDSNGLGVTKESNIQVRGGKCFQLDDSALKQIKNICFDKIMDETDKSPWDGQKLIEMKDVVYIDESEKLININFKGYEKLETDPLTKHLKYVNPTQKYTSRILQDQEIVGQAVNVFLSSINCDNTTNMIDSFIQILRTDGDLCKFNVGSNTINNNLQIMYSFDYLVCCPALCKDHVSNGLPPLSYFIYDVLIHRSSMWNISLPINNTMSCAQINYHISKINPGYSPLYMFTHTALVKEDNNTVSTADKYTAKTFDYNACATPLIKTEIQTGYNSESADNTNTEPTTTTETKTETFKYLNRWGNKHSYKNSYKFNFDTMY